MGRRRKARTSQELRQIAEQVLGEVRVGHPPVPVEAIAKSLGAAVRYAPFKGELAGMLIRYDDERGVVIGVNSLDHKNRQRFTIAHECGHLRLHQGKRAYIDRSLFRINARDGLSSQARDPEEIEANRFAAEVLMPYNMMIDDLRRYQPDIEDENALREIAGRYEVSLQAMTLRIRSIVGDLLI